MELEEEFTLLKDYMKYFINLKYIKEEYNIILKEWDGRGPKPRLYFRSEKELEPLSFKDWMDFHNKAKD